MAPITAHKPAMPVQKRVKSISKESKDAEAAKAEAASAAEAADLARTWRPAPRPEGAAACQDANFTLEDEALGPAAESLLSCYWVSDPTQAGNPLVFVSPAFEALSGFAATEAIGKDANSLLQGHKAEEEAAQAVDAAVKSGTAVSVEITHHRKDGKPWHSHFSMLPVADMQGQLLRWLGVHCDVKAGKEAVAGEEAAAAAAKLTEQVRAHTAAFCLTNGSSDECPITCASPALAQLTGYSQQQLTGCSCLCLVGPDTSNSAMRRLMAMQRGSRHGSLSVLLYRQDGSPFWAHVVSCPVLPPEVPQEGKQGAAPQQSSSGVGLPAEQHLLLVADITCSRPKKVGKYVLGKVLGQGAFGVVRMGKSSATDELVAIKAVDATRFRSIDEIEQVQEEMSVLANLKHPNIIRLLEVHVANNCFYFIMEYASGGCLVRHIYAQEGHRLSEPEAKRVFTQIIAALDYCHKRRVIHRDLKPENILMDTRNNVKVADFGLAAVTAPFNQGQLTLQCGTPEFTAPEICRGKEYSGPAVDMWSLGVMLYEALSGALPFEGPNTAALFKIIQKGVYEPLPACISAEAKDLVKKLLAIDPEKRINMWDLLKHPWVRDSMAGSSGEGEGGAAEADGSRHGLGEGDGEHDSAGMGDFDASHSSQGSPSSERSCEAVHQSGVSFSSRSCHESVRVVIPDGIIDKDDPITAAIMRSAPQSFSEAGPTPTSTRTSGLIESFDDDHTPSPRASSFSSGTMSPATAKELRSAAAGRLSHSSTSGNGRSSGPSKLLPPSPSTPSKAAASSPGSDRRGASTHARSSVDSPLGPQGSGSRGDPARRNVTRQASDNEHSPGAQKAGRPLASTRSGEQLPGSAEARRSGGSESGLSPGGLPRRPAGASATDGGIRKQNSVSHDGAEKSPPGRIKALSGASSSMV